MPSIKIRNLTSATEPEVVSSNFIAAALDENAGLTKSTRKVTFAQVVTGGLKDGVVPIPIGSLPIATDISLGVVQVGANLSITPQGLLSVDLATSLPIATTNSLGVVQAGANLSITPQGLLSVDLATLLPSLPIATTNSLGVVQVGANLSITAGGVLSAPTPAAAPGAVSVFAKAFIQIASNTVSNYTNIAGSTHTANEFTVTFTTGGGVNHALKNVQVTPRVSSISGPFSQYSVQYKWNSATVLVVSIQGMAAIDAISLIIFD